MPNYICENCTQPLQVNGQLTPDAVIYTIGLCAFCKPEYEQEAYIKGRQDMQNEIKKEVK